MPPAVARGLGDAYERWDGKGGPRRLAGEEIERSARILAVAHEAEIHYRLGGKAAAIAMIERGSGGWFEPAVARCLVERADIVLAPLELPSVWDRVLEAEPRPHVRITPGRIEDIARVFAQLTDLKCTFTLGHSEGVAELAAAAAERLGLDVETTRLAGLLHDIGRLGVPTGIWNKPGPLSRGEWERVRLHAYHGERALAQATHLAAAAQIAALHHERLDGSGYHRGVTASMLAMPARVLAAADTYRALCEHRPHRPAFTGEAAAAELQKQAQAGTLDRDAVRAVCEAAGHRVKKHATSWPGGLSDREVEVLRHLARGMSEKQIAKALFISQSTVHTHVVHIYEKIGVSTRAAAALFAMEHGLLEIH
jgi:putative nucleotidyltransferase with HDIG domain